MRYLFLIPLLLLALHSCKSVKEIDMPDPIVVVEHNQNVVDSSNVLPIIEVDKIIHIDNDGDGVPDIKDIEPTSVVNFREIEDDNLNIEDQTSDRAKNSEGIIAYSVPDEMQVGKSYVIKLRITKSKDDESKVDLILGERRNNSINDEDIDTKVVIENIRVEKLMTASLKGDSSKFYIKDRSTKKQVLEDSSYTEWSWIVKPLKGGNSYLKMIITIETDVDGLTKDIVVFDKSIEVKSNVKYSVKSWFSKYWQWLITTIIIPLVIWYYKRRKEKKKEEEKENSEKDS